MGSKLLQILAIASLPFTILTAGAESTVFVSRDANGNPVFSDQATDDAQEIKIQAPQTFESQPPPRFELPENQDPVETGPAYDRLEITSPAKDSAFRNNAGNVTVQVVLSPALQGNHTLEILVDGTVKKRLKTLAPALLENLDRGTHIYTAQVVEDESGEVLLSSPPISSTLQRVSVIRRTN